MKPLRIIHVFTVMILSSSLCCAQQMVKPANALANAPQDTNRVKLLIDSSEQYYFTNPDYCLFLANQAIDLARKINYINGEITALFHAGEALRLLGDFPAALDMQFKALELNRQAENKNGEATSLGFIGLIYADLTEFRQALNYLTQAQKIYAHHTNPMMNSFNFSNIGYAYEGLKMLDSALIFQEKAQEISAEMNQGAGGNLKVLIATRLGVIYTSMDKRELALQYFRNALKNSYLISDNVNPSKIQYQIAQSYLAVNKGDSSLLYARQAFASGEQTFQKPEVLAASNLLVKLFRNNHMPDSVIHYQDIAIAMNDSLFGPAKLRQLQILALKEQEKQQQILQQQQQYKNKIKVFGLVAMLTVFLSIAVILYRNNRQKQKVNQLLQQQKNEIQQTLTMLKSTQSQLIQSEKMASLGELTAGIAHEIQNPLNFVNNFSEVNKELIEELKIKNEKLKIEDNEVKELINDIKDNSEKINHHGKRADAIVKGMLQHSQKSTGHKEPTDINKLADEYFPLAYQGLRAKNSSVNATLKTDFDETIGNINIIPQDIGRVLLNLYNNAFYAVNEKLNAESLQPKADGKTYEPTVSVSTKKVGDKVFVSVKDNGNGIPQIIVDKIFQPFFTTKPTGQGTGLGLSLSYDIINAHGGSLKVKTIENEGSTFTIELTVV